jgi:cell division protein FtsW
VKRVAFPVLALSPDRCGKLAAIIAFVLTAVGVLIIYSSSQFWGIEKSGDPAHFLKRQMFGVVFGVLVFAACATIPYRFWGERSREILIVTGILLVAVLLVGSRYNGARRWLRVAGIGFQPSEVAKLAVIVHVSAFLASQGDRIREFKAGFLRAVVPVGVLSFLILIEPDFGTAVFVAALGVLVLIVGGLRLSHLVVTMATLVPAVTLVMITRFDYIRTRIETFLGSEVHYQVEQGLIALGSGGLFGKGIGAGSGKLFYLPEVAGDFIFPALGEEAGFLGVVLVILLFMAFAWCGWRVATGALPRDRFAFFLAMGITCWIPFQALLNIAVVSDSLPPKGIALPFISYGSTALVMNLAATGILVSIARRRGEVAR